MQTVAIIGGGVAGIACACALADNGFQVELIEKRPLLGGRASSFFDPQTGEPVDECQHGTMRCCTNLDDLFRRLGVQDQIRYFDTLEFLDREGNRSVIKGSGLPAPGHTALSFLAFKSLGLRDKLGIARAMFAMLRARPSPEWDTLSIADWFHRMGQTERALKRFWRPVLVSACNEELANISCRYAFKIFRDGFLAHPHAYHFGVPRVPLGTLYTEPTLRYLKTRGGCVRTRTIVHALEFEGEKKNGGRVAGVMLNDGERIQADYYVSALQFDLLLKLLPDTWTQGVPYWENLCQLELSPLLGAQFWFDRRFDCPPALALLDRETEWVFNKTDLYGQTEGGTYLSLVISASRRFENRPKEAIRDQLLAEIQEAIPGARTAQLVRSHVIRWPKATLVPKPGVDALRPEQCSPIANLFVAGEWTQTGWPSTMEGAARSGYLAAEHLLRNAGRSTRLVAPDLPPAPLVRLFGFRHEASEG